MRHPRKQECTYELQSPKWSGLSNLPPRTRSHRAISPQRVLKMKTKTTQQLHNDYVNIRTFKKSRKFKQEGSKVCDYVTGPSAMSSFTSSLVNIIFQHTFLFTMLLFITLWTSLFYRDPKTSFFI